ncbi:hypothetical protein TREAZ_2821 [Leadbettera azotonutricia ZAS-9]|uniref:Uncharacterized protein n=1 Tax=Leadbettera azotonutricia (strain ATCC BAA-888 / DSM 13862 / ZAS-9) TaxID=545695 RepID=F5YCI9_LEAAZ|nr:hypothetical protein TREAZ_2821 [Leadbettera azotonutricia ZAS-9]
MYINYYQWMQARMKELPKDSFYYFDLVNKEHENWLRSERSRFAKKTG